jgi:hypothetical protein
VILHPDFANRTHFLDGFWEPAGYDPLMPRGANNRIVLTGSVGTPVDSKRRQLIASATGRRFDLSWWSAQQQDTLTTEQMATHQFPGAQFASVERNVVAGAPPTDCFGPDVKGTTFVVPPRFAFCEVEAARLSPTFRDTISAIASARSTSDSLPLHSSLVPGESLGMKPMRTPNGYTFNVTLSNPALLMVRTTWLPGWNVRIDGGKAGQTLCANHWMPAVAVPAGTHEIRFYYRPPHFRAAAAVSVLTCLVIIGGLIARHRARRFGAAAT